MKTLLENKTNTVKVGVVIIALALLVTLPNWGTRGMIPIFTLIMIYIAFGQMWNLLSGYTGLVSLGQHAFIGLGGYALAVSSERFGLPLYVGFIMAAIVSFLFALIISVPIFKIKGVYFTICTWVVAHSLGLFLSTLAFVNYAIGINIRATFRLPTSTIYYVALGVAIVSVLAVYLLLRSRFGLGLMAMRDDEDAAEARGVALYKTKLKCFLISSVIMGVAGAAMFMNLGFILPASAFGIDWTISMVIIVIVGGKGTIEGPIIGAVILVMLRQWLFDFPGYSMLILGAIAIILILVAPKGIMGLVHRFTGAEFFSVRRRPKRITEPK
ncbi:MAG: branched-chain amino acid ABC transporter permease [Oscillospiraceae bacterium]|nr:branched-chain amino acid ABC transporter permease [Oscillospiraceae bacterium]